jgi:RHS repeat-associated protein
VASAATQGGQLYYIVPDHLNTPRMIANQQGTTVWKWDQAEPFGANQPNTDADGDGVGFDFPLRFPGQYFDRETGLAYNWRRDYSAPIGRYIQSDPIGLRGGFNTYAYVGNVPLLAVDPHGLLVTGSWIVPPAFNLEDWGIDSWAFVSPSWSWWGYLKFIRLYGHASGFVNIDVKCVSDEPCSHKEWEIHNHISIDASGSFDVGPNLYALTGGLVLGPWIGGSINIVIAGAVLLQAELHYLQLAEQKAGPVIAAILAGGPTAICLGTDR